MVAYDYGGSDGAHVIGYLKPVLGKQEINERDETVAVPVQQRLEGVFTIFGKAQGPDRKRRKKNQVAEGKVPPQHQRGAQVDDPPGRSMKQGYDPYPKFFMNSMVLTPPKAKF